MLHLPQKTIPDMKSTVTCYDSKLSLKTGKHFLYIEIKQNQCKKRSCFEYPNPLSPTNHRSYWPVTHIQINYNRLSLTYFSSHIVRWQGKQNRKPKMKLCANFTLYTLTSVCIISILFSIHFQRCWLEEFVYQSRANLLARCRVSVAQC